MFYACIVVDIDCHVFSLVLGGDNLIWVIRSTWIQKWTKRSLLAGEMSVLPRYAGKLLLPFVQEFLKVVSEAGCVSSCFFDVTASKVFRVAMETWTARLWSDINSIYLYLDKNEWIMYDIYICLCNQYCLKMDFKKNYNLNQFYFQTCGRLRPMHLARLMLPCMEL